MSIHETLHYYDADKLVAVPVPKLKVARLVLQNKIGFMREVAKQQSVCAEVYADLRKYEAAHAARTGILAITA